MTATVLTTIEYSNYLFYIVVSIICLVLMVMKNKDFNPKDLIGSFVSLTNFIVLFALFVSCLLAFIFEFLNIDGVDVDDFITQVIRELLYYCFIGYGTFYMLKLFAWIKEFVEKNDLMYLSYFEKKAEMKVRKK